MLRYNGRIFQLVKDKFKGRTDAYFSDLRNSVKRDITFSTIRKHFCGEERIGIYPLSPDILDGKGTYLVCIDIDIDVHDVVKEASKVVEELGFRGYVERSKSKGWHVWIFFSEAVKALHARAVGLYVVEKVRDKFPEAKIEVFPKQNSLENVEFGNPVNLPLFKKDVKQERTVFVDVENGFKPIEDQIKFLEDVEKFSSTRLTEVIESEEIELSEKQISDTGAKTTGKFDMCPCVAKMLLGVEEGCRNKTGFALAKHFRVEKNLPKNVIFYILWTWNKRNKPPLEEKEVRQIAKSACEGREGKGYTSFNCEDFCIKPFCDKGNCPLYSRKRYTKLGGDIIGELITGKFNSGIKVYLILLVSSFDNSVSMKQKKIAKECGMSESNVSEKIRDLEKYKLIEVDRSDYGNFTYRLKPTKTNKFVRVYHSVIKSRVFKNMNFSDLLGYLFLLLKADHDTGESFFSQGRIAEKLGLCRETVNRAVKRLCEYGLIRKEERSDKDRYSRNRSYFIRAYEDDDFFTKD